MRSHEIVTEWKIIPDKADDAASILTSNGWEKVGAGYHAEVFSKPSLDYVVKIFERDSAYLAFLKLVQAHPNKHFPKIKGKMHISPTCNGVRLEKLLPPSPVKIGEFMVRPSAMLAAYLIEKNYNLSEDQERNLEFCMIYLKDKPELVEALELINELLDGHDLDMNYGNIMNRPDGTLVIIDPVA